MQNNLFTMKMKENNAMQFIGNDKCNAKENYRDYRHTESLTLFYFTDKAFHTHTRTNKNPGEKETKEKELPWLCWFAGVVRLPSARVPSAHTDPQPKRQLRQVVERTSSNHEPPCNHHRTRTASNTTIRVHTRLFPHDHEHPQVSSSSPSVDRPRTHTQACLLHRPSIDPEHTILLTACPKTPLSDAKALSSRPELP